MTQSFGPYLLTAAGILTAMAALAHLACIPLGARAYRFMGAGERMARAAEAGERKPGVVTAAIAVVLCVWALYAFSGAGVIGELPFTALVLVLISVVLLVRGFGFPLLRTVFPENSTVFWLVSSGICLVLGSLYAGGAFYVWAARLA